MSDIQTIDVRSGTREEMIDITSQVRAAIRRSGVSDGICCIYCPHTTAGVTIQENSDPDVKADLVGATTTVIIEDGKPLLGHWQAVFFCEFDGPRARSVRIKVIAG